MHRLKHYRLHSSLRALAISSIALILSACRSVGYCWYTIVAWVIYVIPLAMAVGAVHLRTRGLRRERGEVDSRLQEEMRMRRQAEQALQESAESYHTLVKNSLVALYIVQDGFFRFVNRRFCTVLGYLEEEIVDRMTPGEVVHPDYRKVLHDHMERIADDELKSLEIELKAVKKDKGVIIIKVLAGSTVYNGQLAHFGTFIDITKEKTLESQLRQAQKMEAIGTLAGGIAHDFNNILTALSGYGTLLRARMEAADPRRHYVDQMLSASHKATSLTQSLMAFGRLQPISLEPVNINALIRGTEGLLRRLITEDIVLSTSLTVEDIVVMADATQIDQILFNLATNARDAMPRGGALTIGTSLVEIDNDFILAHGFGEAGRYALIAVSDTGMGMDEKTRERIFDPFYTTKETGKGTGLGLSTVYGIVKQHRGYITVWSEPLHGATFRIYLPAVRAVATEVQPSAIDLIHGAETVLVADDNREVRGLLKEMLGHYGYRVIEATDGEEAIGKFKAHTAISLAILDLVMPKKNGRQVYEAMKAMRADIKTLFMSGHTKQVIIDRGMEGDGVDFIEKPFAPEEFLKKVAHILAH
jgi:PAS domain S-box-containing protein